MRCPRALAVLLYGGLLISGRSFIVTRAAAQGGLREGWIESRQDLLASSTKPSERKPARPKPVNKRTPTSPRGLGYTLFLRDRGGEMVRVSPQRVFHHGDQLRLLVESNQDGYIYVLHRENEGEPTLLFPTSERQPGTNRIYAHRPVWVPFEHTIEFDEKPAVETFTLIVTSRPLGESPIARRPNRGRTQDQIAQFDRAASSQPAQSEFQPPRGCASSGRATHCKRRRSCMRPTCASSASGS